MAADPPDIFDHLDYTIFLSAWFEHQKESFAQKGRTYSHRMFVQAAGITHVGLLHQVIHGKRRLTPPLIAAFRKPLGLTAHEADYLELLVRREQAALERDRLVKRLAEEEEKAERGKTARAGARVASARQAVETAQRSLDLVEQEAIGRQKMHRAQRATARLKAVLTTWYTPIIRDLKRCDGYREDVDWVYRAMKGEVTPAQIREALEALAEAEAAEPGEVAEGKDARLALVVERAPGLDLRPFYTGVHEQGRKALEAKFDDNPPGAGVKSWLGALTVPLPLGASERMRATIQKHQSAMFSALEGLSEDPDTVYVVLVQAFPVTERTSGEPEPKDSEATKKRSPAKSRKDP